MFTTLLAKQQFKLIVNSWHKQQLQLLMACLYSTGNTTISPNINDYAGTSTEQVRWNASLVRARSSQRLYNTTNAQQSGRHGKQLESLEALEESNSFGAEEYESFVHNFNLKQLYSTEDDIMKKLNASENISQVKSVVEAEKSNLHKEHIVQSIILLWIFNENNDTTSHTSKAEDENFMQYILSLLKDNISNLNINELSACYLYLRKMGVENSDPVLQKILLQALDDVGNAQGIIDLPSLSRLVVGINIGRDFFTPMLCANFIRHLQHHIDLCNDEEDARLIAICMYNLKMIINKEMFDLYKRKVSDLIASGQISSATPKTVIKILNMLNMTVWSHQHVPLIRKLLLTLETCLKKLEGNDLKTICRIYQYHMEPASLHEPLAGAMEEMLSSRMTTDTLSCFIPFAEPQRRETLINAFKALISSPECWQSQHSTSNLFTILRGLKISDTKICNAYWNGVLAALEAIPAEETHLHFLRHCHRYMNFNNNLGGTYRHIELEKKLSQLCMRAIEHDVSGRIPHKFVRLASFVLAYGHTPYSWRKYPNILLSKIITMGQQFTPTDCFFIGRGIQISLEMRYNLPWNTCYVSVNGTAVVWPASSNAFSGRVPTHQCSPEDKHKKKRFINPKQ